MKTKSLFLIVALFLFGLSSYAQNGNGFQAQSELTDDERATIEQRVLEKIDDFISYLPEIAAKKNKSADEQQLAQKYISKALELFIGEGEDYEYEDQAGNKRMHEAVKMQTTSRGRANAPQPMKRYLNRLMALPYQKVEVESCKAIRIDKHLHFISNNRWSGSAVFMQVFRATRDGRLVVNDTDEKQVTFYVDREEYAIGPNGEKQVVWTIRLGDMRIANKYR